MGRELPPVDFDREVEGTARRLAFDCAVADGSISCLDERRPKTALRCALEVADVLWLRATHPFTPRLCSPGECQVSQACLQRCDPW